MEKYIETLKKLGINTTSVHWVAKFKYQREKAQKALEKLFESSGISYAKPKQICKVDGCFNPLHYVQPIEEDLVPSSLDEVVELTEMINVNELKDLGFDDYLELFNKDNPLPAKRKDFFIACNRKLRRKNLPPLPESLLWEKDDENL